MSTLTVPSPAKINLLLYVLGKRRDGYHRIATLFHRLSLVDEIRLSKQSRGLKLHCSHPLLPVGETNIITRAYRALQKDFPNLGGVSVRLKKRIPMGAGLGGGSSNAASFLLAMKKLYGLKISQERLVRIGMKLGADVPFFLYQANQGFGISRGDRIRVRKCKRRQWILLVVSYKGLSTKTVYQTYRKPKFWPSLTKVSRAVTMLCEFLNSRNMEQIAKSLHNDLEASAFRLRPSLRKVISTFERMGISTASMSGSGPTIFAVLKSKREARRTARQLRKKFPAKTVVLCHTW